MTLSKREVRNEHQVSDSGDPPSIAEINQPWNQQTDFGANELDRMFTRHETARFLKVSVPTLERWSRDGIGPRFVRIGPRRVGYPVRGLLEFLAQRTAL